MSSWIYKLESCLKKMPWNRSGWKMTTLLILRFLVFNMSSITSVKFFDWFTYVFPQKSCLAFSELFCICTVLNRTPLRLLYQNHTARETTQDLKKPLVVSPKVECELDFGAKITGIVSDSNNIFLQHESEDINTKRLFPKFQLMPILRLQVMHDYVHWHCSIDFCMPCF